MPVILCGVMIGLTGLSQGQVDLEINRQLWKQKYGVLEAQLAEQAPYLGWMGQDADGDGVKNEAEFLAGTNPFRKLPTDPHFRAPSVSQNPSSLTLTFPSVRGKRYGVEANQALVDAWTSAGLLPNVTGDGSPQSLTVPMSAGKFFHLSVSDQASQGDQVSDWAKDVLGYSAALSIESQSGYNHSSLATNLQQQNIISLAATDGIARSPADAVTAASDFAYIRISRAGFMQLGAITVPLTKGGTAIEDVDYVALPNAVTFPAGLNSIDLKIIPIYQATRTSSATVQLAASAAGTVSAAGTYTLGNPSFAGVTLYPTFNPIGTGLTANYYPGSSATYSSPLNFGNIAAASYSYTKATTTSGSAVITYVGNPTLPFTIGSTVNLQFTSGSLNVTAYNSPANYTIVAPVTSTSFAVAISGAAVPNTGTGNLYIANFNAPFTSLSPTVDYTWGHGTPNGNNFINADNYSVTWDGFLAPSTAGTYTFRLDADDKARVFIDTGAGLQQILENGWDTPATGGYKNSAPIVMSIPATAANRYPIRVDFVETTGNAKMKFQWQLGSGAFVTIPAANVFINNTGATTGWNGNYYNNSTFALPIARAQTDADPTAGNNGDWLTGSPDVRLHHNNLSARWTGQILPQYSQTYYFVAKANDGFRLWVNNQLILDRWTTGNNVDQTGSIDLQADVLYDIKLESYELTGSCEAHLSWYSEDQARQVIPVGRLFPSLPAIPSITGNLNPKLILGTTPAFTFPIANSNGGTLTATGLPSWLSLVNGVLTQVGTPPGAGIYQFTIITTNAAGSGSAIISLEVMASDNQLTRELWTTGVAGPALSQVPWASIANSTDTVSLPEDNNTSYGTNTGERLSGYITAPVTGNYYFWIAASNVAELWISNDAESVNKVRRASVTGPAGTALRTWNAQVSQKSAWLSLVAGQKYYIEILHNTGSSAAANHLSVAWFLDPTGLTASPVVNGSAPATASIGGVIPSSALGSWDNPPTLAVPGTLYITSLQSLPGLTNVTANGGAFLRVAGSTAVLQLNDSGVTSGIISRKIMNAANQVVYDIDSQNRNYLPQKTSDGGYTWNLTGTDLLALNSGQLHLRVATMANPNGELDGTFLKIPGSQVEPAAPVYPTWPDLHATSDAANSRFLTQATFGPSPADMLAVKAIGYRPWLENQFNLTASHHVPNVLASPTNDPQNLYNSSLFFNSWWKNAITAPDQFRQRAAFALSEILVVSDTGPLNNNGRVLADYSDTLLDFSFGNFRDILRQVTLSPAMGVYLDMRGNAAGSLQTGIHPNENYAREIMQLFSCGLYHLWPDGSLILNSNGDAVPTYDQSVITGMARVFTGWNWGQAMNGGRLSTAFNGSSNYLDPMVLVPTQHELGTKRLLDNVILPAATVTSQADTSTDPTSTYSIQSTDPLLGPGNLVTTLITNQYDLNGLKDLEAAIDSIINNPATGPYICRQLIQRLVTSSPKPAYVHRVVRAFNGQQNVDGIATGVRGDMKEVFRAILLDYEARSSAAAADPQYGKQREPLLRITGPARSFPSTPLPSSTYRQLGLQAMLIKTPAPHRLINNDNVLLNSFVDAGNGTGNLPYSQSYAAKNTTPSYSLDSPSGNITLTAPAYQVGDVVPIQFTSGPLSTTAPYNTVQNYTVVSASPSSFTVNIGSTGFVGTLTGNATTPNHFTVDINSLTAPSYNSAGNLVTITSSGFFNGEQLYLKFSSGGLSNGGFDGVYTVANSTATTFTVTLASSPVNTSGVALIPKLSGGYNVTANGAASSIALYTGSAHNLNVGDLVQVHFLVANLGTPAQNAVYPVTSVTAPNQFTITTATAVSNGSQGSSGMVAYPLSSPTWNRSGTLTVSPSTWNLGYTQTELGQTPLNSVSVFNFFYPDFKNPGEIAEAGMTTPEFQLTNDSSTMTLTNTVTNSIGTAVGTGNPEGFSSFKSGAVTMDLKPYMTPAQTSDAGIPALVDTLNALLTSGNLTPAARTIIINYVANSTNFPYTTPTNYQMRDRVRAAVQLILTSAEYAIQK